MNRIGNLRTYVLSTVLHCEGLCALRGHVCDSLTRAGHGGVFCSSIHSLVIYIIRNPAYRSLPTRDSVGVRSQVGSTPV